MSVYLLDTHVLLWAFEDNPKLSPEVRQAIEQGDKVYASVVSVWEIVIKQALSKLEAPHDLQGAITETKLTSLCITVAHAVEVRKLPRGRHKTPSTVCWSHRRESKKRRS